MWICYTWKPGDILAVTMDLLLVLWISLLSVVLMPIPGVSSQRLSITHIKYKCVQYPCYLRFCGYVLTGLRACPISTTTLTTHTTHCSDSHCEDVQLNTFPIGTAKLDLNSSSPHHNLVSIKAYLRHSAAVTTCGTALSDSCWDLNYTNTQLLAGSALSFQVEEIKPGNLPSPSTGRPSPSTAPTTNVPVSMAVPVKPLHTSVPVNPLPTPLKGKSQDDDDDEFPAAAAAGIAIGILVLLIILVILICLCCKNKKKETVVAVVNPPAKTDKVTYPAPLRYEEYMKAGPLPAVIQRPESVHAGGGSETGSYHIEVVDDPNKSRKKKKRKSGKRRRKEQESERHSDYGRTTGEDFHRSQDTFYINASTQPYGSVVSSSHMTLQPRGSVGSATPLTLPLIKPEEEEEVTPRKHKKKRRSRTRATPEFEGIQDAYTHM